MNKTFVLIVICIASLSTTACINQNITVLPVIEDYIEPENNSKKSSLKMGIVSGPYGDMFTEIILPLFSQKGYDVEFVLYDNYTSPNFALASGDIDLNMFQNYEYLNNFKFENNLNLSAIAEIPTASMGVYSYKYKSIEEIEYGAVIAIPNDSTNHSRALSVLSSTGLISISNSSDTRKITTENITKNIKNVQFIPTEAHLIVENLHLYDLAVINGNYALDNGLNDSEALFTEKLNTHYMNVIAVRTEDLSKPFVTDLVDVLRLAEYVDKVKDADGKYANFQYPLNFINH